MQIDPLNSVLPAPAITPARNEDAAAFRRLVTAVRALNRTDLYGQDRELQFARDESTRMLVIRLVQPNTGEVIEQIPPEAVLRAFEELQKMNGGQSKK